MRHLAAVQALLCLFIPALCLAQNVQVTGFQNLSAGSWAGGDVEVTDTLCVYKSSGNKSYMVTPSGQGSGGSFEMTNGSDTFGYEFRWRKIGNSNFKKHTANQTKNHGGANRNDTDCGGTDNAEVKITIKSSELSSVPAGTYSGTVTVLIEPV